MSTTPNVHSSVRNAQRLITEPRFPGSMSLLRMVSDQYPTIDDAEDALTAISALQNFVFGYVDEPTKCTVSFHVDAYPDRAFAPTNNLTRVFSFAPGVRTA